MVATPEALALIKAFAAKILPAKLADTNRNGLLLADWINTHRGGVQTVDNMVDSASAQYRELDWDRKPEKLLREEREQRPRNELGVLAEVQAFADKQKKSEQDALDAKEVEKLVKQCGDMIQAYLPTRQTSRGTVIDNHELESSQTTWKATLAKTSKQGVVAMRAYTKSLGETIAARYTTIEKRSERI